MNWLGLSGVALALSAFAAAYAGLKRCRVRWRVAAWLGGSVLALPALWFTAYYLHVLPEYAWFYTLRSWPGSELLAGFLGAAGGALASLLPRWLLGVPLTGVVGLAAVPYLKPLVSPLTAEDFRERWKDGVCLQSTPATCGPASTVNMLRHLHKEASEREVARAAFSYTGGTEAWYLARYARRAGLQPRFEFHEGFAPAAGAPAMVGVKLGGYGHFLAVLEVRDGLVVYVDPLEGRREMPLGEFQRRYRFTGFHMVLGPAGPA